MEAKGGGEKGIRGGYDATGLKFAVVRFSNVLIDV